MTRAFIIHIELEDQSPMALAAVSDEIEDACSAAGLAVDRVIPWAAPSSAPTLPSDPSQLFGGASSDLNPLA